MATQHANRVPSETNVKSGFAVVRSEPAKPFPERQENVPQLSRTQRLEGEAKTVHRGAGAGVGQEQQAEAGAVKHMQREGPGEGEGEGGTEGEGGGAEAGTDLTQRDVVVR